MCPAAKRTREESASNSRSRPEGAHNEVHWNCRPLRGLCGHLARTPHNRTRPHRTNTINNQQEADQHERIRHQPRDHQRVTHPRPRAPRAPVRPGGLHIRIAHNERFKDAAGEWADRAAFFDVTIWSGLGEWIGNNVSKGDKVVVAGRLRWREWEKDGDKRQAVDITADSVIPIPRTASAQPADEAPVEEVAAA